MAKIKLITKPSKISITFWIGATLTLTGIAISIYATTMIKIREEKLFFWNLTQQERWDLEGSLRWWRLAKITLYDPLSLTLIAIGLTTIVYALILAIKQPTTKNKPPQQ